jgi:hypothetical protein
LEWTVARRRKRFAAGRDKDGTLLGKVLGCELTEGASEGADDGFDDGTVEGSKVHWMESDYR